MTLRVTPAWTLGVLAGGRSQRMGRDKASIPFGPTTLLEHQVARLAPPGVPVLVGTRPDGPGRDLGLPWVADIEPEAGPLSSVPALLLACETPWLVLVPCDAPLLPEDTGDRLLEFAGGVEAVVLARGGRSEPVPALLSVDLEPLVRACLEAGERRLDGWHDRAACAVVPFERVWPEVEPETALLNVNTEDDLRQARSLSQAGFVDPGSGH